MAADILLKAVDMVEILTLQDNYIDITAMDNSAIVTRANPIRDGEIRASILAEHGFSALVRTRVEGVAHTLLFDFGFSEDGAARNAETLSIDMTQVEAAALSHGHSDHMGGMRRLAAMTGRPGMPMVAHPSAFKAPRYLKFGEEFRIYWPKLDRENVKQMGLSIMETAQPYPMLDHTILFLGEIPRVTDFEKGWPLVHRRDDGREIFDPIEDDSAVVMNLKDKGLVILSGCAHAGIVNTLLHAVQTTGVKKIHAVMGGFHLTGPLFESIIGRTAGEIRTHNPDYVIPTHCTGHKAMMEMEKLMPDKFILNMAGTKLTFT